MSNIYIVGQPNGHGFIKIGMTTRSVHKRIGDWDTGSPYDWEVHLDLQVTPKTVLPYVEASVHRTLIKAGLHKRLEWFAADAAVATAALYNALIENGVPITGTTLHSASAEYEREWWARVRGTLPAPA